jgi:hypothetical protein
MTKRKQQNEPQSERAARGTETEGSTQGAVAQETTDSTGNEESTDSANSASTVDTESINNRSDDRSVDSDTTDGADTVGNVVSGPDPNGYNDVPESSREELEGFIANPASGGAFPLDEEGVINGVQSREEANRPFTRAHRDL